MRASRVKRKVWSEVKTESERLPRFARKSRAFEKLILKNNRLFCNQGSFRQNKIEQGFTDKRLTPIG